MPKTVFAIALAALALVSGAAAAADITPYAAPARAALFWQGPYVGANLGYQWGLATHIANKPVRRRGRRASGLQLADRISSYSAAKPICSCPTPTTRFAGWKFSNPWFGTLRARAGFATNNLLFYGTVGLAYGTLTAKDPPTGVSESRTSAGWAAGAGVEVALMANWTARAEYLYVDLNDRSFVLDGREPRHRVEPAAHRRELSLLTGSTIGR